MLRSIWIRSRSVTVAMVMMERERERMLRSEEDVRDMQMGSGGQCSSLE